MVTNPHEITAGRLAIDLAKEYVLRVITEEDAREGREETIDLLKEVITDIKISDRFYTFRSLQEVHEIYMSLCTTPYLKDFIHNGATFVVLSLGASKYATAVKELIEAMETSFATTVTQGQGKIIDAGVPSMLQSNAWLVFCLLCKFAWFNQPTSGEEQQ